MNSVNAPVIVFVPKLAKKERKKLTIDEKMDVIRRMESGDRRSDVCKALSLAPSTVTTIMNNVNKIKRTYAWIKSVSSSGTTYSRSETMEKMENLLLLWIDYMNKNNIPYTKAIVLDKAKTLFDEICEESGSTETFTASRGWFHRFKNRSKIHSVKVSDDADADVIAEEQYPSEYTRCWKRMKIEAKKSANNNSQITKPVEEATSSELSDEPRKRIIEILQNSMQSIHNSNDHLALSISGHQSNQIIEAVEDSTSTELANEPRKRIIEILQNSMQSMQNSNDHPTVSISGLEFDSESTSESCQPVNVCSVLSSEEPLKKHSSEVNGHLQSKPKSYLNYQKINKHLNKFNNKKKIRLTILDELLATEKLRRENERLRKWILTRECEEKGYGLPPPDFN